MRQYGRIPGGNAHIKVSNFVIAYALYLDAHNRNPITAQYPRTGLCADVRRIFNSYSSVAALLIALLSCNVRVLFKNRIRWFTVREAWRMRVISKISVFICEKFLVHSK
jgi:hypothetical protein